MRRAAVLAGLLSLLILALGLKGLLLTLPDAAAPAAGGFDAARAVARLHRVLGDQRPHPVDSGANDAVRTRLVAELRGLGLDPAVTDDLACNGSTRSRAVTCARVRNVLATIGPRNGRQVLVVSHYDSTPVGPGAADDGIGVAVMLEAVALLRRRRLERPVTFLFNEGEEAGLLGARAFVENHPLADRVDAAVNLEARGVSGPAIMFETSRPNGGAIAAFARSANRPVASSLTADFYRLLPNDTDVSVFRERPWTILNFAIIGNETRYHSPGDRIEALDPRSVRHMGEQALAAIGQLANAPAAPVGDRVYADLLGRVLVVLPQAGGLGLLAALLLTFAWLARIRRGGIGRAAAIAVTALGGAAALSFLAQAGLGSVRPGAFWRAHPEVTALAVHLSALLACALALLRLGRPLARDRLRIGFWLVFLLLGTGISLAAPGAVIFFLLPPLVAGAAMLARRWERAAALLAWALLFLAWAPLLRLSEMLLDLDAGWIFAPVAALIVLPALIELKPLLARAPAGALLGGLAGAAALGWTAAAFAPAYSADRKQAFGIEYVREEAERRGRWMVVNDGAPLPSAFAAAGRFEEGVEVPWSSRRRWAADAAPLPLPTPRVDRIGERRLPGGRLVSLRLRGAGADALLLRAKPEADWRAARIGGSVARFGAGTAKDDYVLRCHGRSCDGARIDLLVGNAAPTEVILAAIRSGLPATARPLVRARPAHAAPQYGADSTIVVSRLRL